MKTEYTCTRTRVIPGFELFKIGVRVYFLFLLRLAKSVFFLEGKEYLKDVRLMG